MFDRTKLPAILERPSQLRIEEVEVLTDFSEAGSARYCAGLVKVCSRFDEDAFLELPQDDKRYNCKSVMGLLVAVGLSSIHKKKVNIIVEPNSEYARELALLVESSLTDPDKDRAGVNRFPAKSTQQ